MNCNNTISNKEKYPSLSYINSWLLNKCSRTSNLLQPTYIQFDVIAIIETQITKNISVTQNAEFRNYSFEHTPRESSAGGSLL